MMIRAAIFASIVWIGFTCARAGQTPAAPPAATSLTFPVLTGRVVDDAGLLSAAERAGLATSLADLEAKTTDQLVIVTLKSLQGTSIEDYGYQLGRRWHIGQKDKDSGALLIVVASEHRVRIEVGYGLEGTLTDAATKLIIENAIVPPFKTGDFSGGIRNGTIQIIQLLEGDAATGAPVPGTVANVTAQSNGPNGETLTWPAIVVAVAAVGLLIFCAIHGGGACRVLMQIAFLMLLSGRGGSSQNRSSSFSGGGGSFGGGGSSGSW